MHQTLISALVLVVFAAACGGGAASAPNAPIIRASFGGPGNSRQVTIVGSATEGSTIELYADEKCASAALMSVTALQLMNGVQVEARANATTVISARAMLGGLFSGCSAPTVYVHDDIAPTVPVMMAVTALNPNPPRVRVEGTADRSSRVRLFLNDGCTGAPVLDAVSEDGTISFELDVPANAETKFAATAVDSAGNASACSSPALRFVHDEQPPAPPQLTSITPQSPSQLSIPTIVGIAEAGARVEFFFDSSCAANAAGTAVVDASGVFTSTVAMQTNTNNRVYARAVDASINRSSCVLLVIYEHDDLPASLPTFSVSPLSPSRTATEFDVVASSEFGATIRLYGSADCSGAATNGHFIVTPNVPFPVSARATDALGNASACAAGPVLLNDTVAPVAPSITNSVPVSPSATSTTPTLVGLAEARGTLQLFRTGDCTSTSSTYTVGANGQFSASTSVTSNTARTFSATVTDLAGNVSPCSAPFTFTHDNRVPVAPIFWGTLPPSPSKSSGPVHVMGAAETGVTVQLFVGTACVGVAAATGPAGALINSTGVGAFDLSVTVGAGTTSSFVARAVDAAGNGSTCTTVPLSFTQSTTLGWSDAASLGFSTGRNAYPEVAFTPSGEAVAIFNHLDTAPQGVFRSERVSGAWTTPTLLSDPSATVPALTSPPNLVTDASGTVLAAWSVQSVAQGVRRAPDGSWTALALGASDYGRAPDVALDGAGNGVITYERFVTSTVRIFARRSTGATWDAESLISDVNYSSFAPRVVMAPGGRAVISYSRNTGSGSSPRDELWTSTGESGAAFGVPTQRSPSTSLFDRRDARIGMTSAGETIALWLQSTQNLGPWTLTSAATTSGTWAAGASLPSTVSTSRRELQVATLPTGEAMALWTTNAGVLTFARRTSGAWGGPATLPGAVVGSSVRLVGDSTGRFIAAWTTVDAFGGSGQLWFAIYTPGSGWSAAQLLEVGLTTFFTVALDAQGRALAAWSVGGSLKERHLD